MKFAEMLSLIEKGKADGIISWHPDRLARNSVDGGKIIHFVDRGLIKSLKFPTFWFEPTPQGLFMLNIAFGQSKYFVDNLRENVKRGLRQKIRNGVWPGWAPVGYLNNPKTRLIDIDRAKAQKVEKLFEFYSTGRYTLKSLANWSKEKGLRGNLGKEIAVSNVQKILNNPFYIGLMKYRGEIFEGQHEPLISKKLFDKCQEVMSKRGKVQEVRKYNFAFLGLMKCASCGCSITAEIQKGHNYYRCTKKKGICQEKHYLREEVLSEQIKSFLQKVSLSSQDTEKVLAALNSEQEQAKQQAKSKIEGLKDRLKQVEAKLAKLLDVYLTDALSTEEYATKKQELLSQKMEFQEKISDFEQKGLSWLEPAREFVLSLNQATKLLSAENPSEMTTFLKNIGSNHILRNRQLIFSPKIPYNLIAERSEANPNRLQIPYWCLFMTPLELTLSKIHENIQRASCPPKAGRRDTPFLQRRKRGTQCKCKMDSVLRNYFLGEWFAKPRLRFLKFGGDSEFCPRGGRVWEGIRAGLFLGNLGGGFNKKHKLKKSIIFAIL